jgi:hypothetical protein
MASGRHGSVYRGSTGVRIIVLDIVTGIAAGGIAATHVACIGATTAMGFQASKCIRELAADLVPKTTAVPATASIPKATAVAKATAISESAGIVTAAGIARSGRATSLEVASQTWKGTAVAVTIGAWHINGLGRLIASPESVGIVAIVAITATAIIVVAPAQTASESSGTRGRSDQQRGDCDRKSA